MGAFWLIDYYGGTMNMITMFACIMALGILVDDAIVVGENIYSHWRDGKTPVRAAIDGYGYREIRYQPESRQVYRASEAMLEERYVTENMTSKTVSADERRIFLDEDAWGEEA